MEELEEYGVATEETEKKSVSPRQRKVSAHEARQILGTDSHGQEYNLIETADGRLAILPYRGVIMVLPEKWDLDEWNNPINPLLTYSSRNFNDPLLTETNIDFGKNIRFFWGVIDGESKDGSGQYWFRLCDPNKATHQFVEDIADLKVRKLATDDNGDIPESVEWYKSESGYSTFLMPIGFIRLNYTERGGDVRSLDGEALDHSTLQKLFSDRSRDSVQAAQDALDARRAKLAELAEIVEQAVSEQKHLAPEISALAERCDRFITKVSSECRDDHVMIERYIPGEFHFKIGPRHGYRLSGFGKSFEVSEAGIDQFHQTLDSYAKKFKDEVETQKHQKAQAELRQRFADAAYARHIWVELLEERPKGQFFRHHYIEVRIRNNLADVTIYNPKGGSSAQRIPITEEDFSAYCDLLDQHCCGGKARLYGLLCTVEDAVRKVTKPEAN